jgi:hypothetical protein
MLYQLNKKPLQSVVLQGFETYICDPPGGDSNEMFWQEDIL